MLREKHRPKNSSPRKTIVFEVVWLALTKVRCKWLQDSKGDAVKARFVAQLRTESASMSLQALWLLEHCWLWPPAQIRKKPGTPDCPTSQQHSSTHQQSSSSFSFLMRVEALGDNLLEGLEQRRVDLEHSVSKNVARHVSR